MFLKGLVDISNDTVTGCFLYFQSVTEWIFPKHVICNIVCTLHPFCWGRGWTSNEILRGGLDKISTLEGVAQLLEGAAGKERVTWKLGKKEEELIPQCTLCCDWNKYENVLGKCKCSIWPNFLVICE